MRDRRKRKRKATAKPTPVAQPTLTEIVAKVTAAFAEIAPDAIKKLTECELRAKRAEENFAFLNEKLVGLLTADQLEAAKVCGIDPALYAINWIELWQSRMFQDNNAIGVKSFAELRR